MDQEKLPRIVEPWQVIGEVRDQAAADFGLSAGTLIAAGAGDTAANALGAGIVRSGMVFDVAGTASVLAGCTDRFTADTENRALLTMRSVIPGLWHPMAYIGGGGLALRWFRNQFYNILHGQPQATEDDLYDGMTAAAARIVPGADGLMFSPHLGGRICPSVPEMRGSWIGFSWSHTQAHFLRAILESVAFEYAYYLRILKSKLPDHDLIVARVVGGGARSAVWNQIKADVLGIPYQRLQRSEFGTWGSAMIAGKAAGIFENLAETAELYAYTAGEPFVPDSNLSESYDQLVQQYIRTQELLAGYFREENSS